MIAVQRKHALNIHMEVRFLFSIHNVFCMLLTCSEFSLDGRGVPKLELNANSGNNANWHQVQQLLCVIISRCTCKSSSGSVWQTTIANVIDRHGRRAGRLDTAIIGCDAAVRYGVPSEILKFLIKPRGISTKTKIVGLEIGLNIFARVRIL